MFPLIRLWLILSLIAQLALSQPCSTMLILRPSLVCAGGTGNACGTVGPFSGSCRYCRTGNRSTSRCGDGASGCGGSTGCGTDVTVSLNPKPLLLLNTPEPCDPAGGNRTCDTCPPIVPQKIPGAKDIPLVLPLVFIYLLPETMPRPRVTRYLATIEPQPPPSHRERRARLGVWLN